MSNESIIIYKITQKKNIFHVQINYRTMKTRVNYISIERIITNFSSQCL